MGSLKDKGVSDQAFVLPNLTTGHLDKRLHCIDCVDCSGAVARMKSGRMSIVPLFG